MSNKFQKELKIFSRKQKIEIKKELIDELFSNVISNFDSQKILNFSIEYQIPLTIVDGNGDTLIHKIIGDDNCRQNELNKLNFIKFLVNQGVGPDSPNSDNIKPIHLACKKQLSLIIDYLLSIRVDINFADNFGNTPLHYFLNGHLYDYKNLTPIELIQPKEIKQDDLTFEEKTAYEKFIWNQISNDNNDKDIRFIKNTIEKILLNDKNSLDKYNETLKSINEKLDNKSVISDIKSKHSDINDYISRKFNNFVKIDEIEIHNEEFNSWEKGNITGLSILKNIGSSENPIQDYINNLIGENIDSLKNMFNNNNLFSSQFSKSVHLPLSGRGTPIQEGLPDEINLIDPATGNFNIKYSEERNGLLQSKANNLDSYFGDLILDDKSFIGGARTVTLRLPNLLNNDDFWNLLKNIFNNRNQIGGGQNNNIFDELYSYNYKDIPSYDLELLYLINDFVKLNSKDPTVLTKIRYNMLEKIVRKLEQAEFISYKNEYTKFIEDIYDVIERPDLANLDLLKSSNRIFPNYDNFDSVTISNKLKVKDYEKNRANKELNLKNEEITAKDTMLNGLVTELNSIIDEKTDIIDNLKIEVIDINKDLIDRKQNLDNLHHDLDKKNNENFNINDFGESKFLNPDLQKLDMSLDEVEEKISELGTQKQNLENENDNIKEKYNITDNQQILQFDNRQSKVDLEKEVNTKLKNLEEKRRNIYSDIIKISKDNEEKRKLLNEYQDKIDKQKVEALKNEMKFESKMGLKEYEVKTKEKEAEDRINDAKLKYDEAKRNFESAEIDKKEAIEIKENAEKEIEDMKRQFKDDSFDLRIKTMEQRNTIDDQTREISRIDSELEEKSKKLQESEEAVNSLTSDLGYLEGVLEEEKEQGEEKTKKINQLNEKNQELTTQLEELIKNNNITIENLRQSQGIIEKQKSELENTIENLKKSDLYANSLVDEKYKLSQEIEKIEKEKDQLEAKLNDEKKYLDQVSDISEGRLKMIETSREHIKSLYSRLDQKIEEYNNLNDTLEEQKSENLTTQNQLESANEELKKLKDDYNQQGEQILELQSDNSDLILSKEKLEKDIQDLNDSHDELISDYEDKVAILKDEVRKMVKSGTDYVEDKERKIQELLWLKTKLQIENLYLKEEVEEKRKENANIVSLNLANQSENNDFQNYISELESIITQKDDNINTLIDELKNANLNLDRKEVILEQLLDYLESLENNQINEMKKSTKHVTKKKKNVQDIHDQISNIPFITSKVGIDEFNIYAKESEETRNKIYSADSGRSGSKSSGSKSLGSKSSRSKRSGRKSSGSKSSGSISPVSERSGNVSPDTTSSGSQGDNYFENYNIISEKQARINELNGEKIRLSNYIRMGQASNNDQERLKAVNQEISDLEAEIESLKPTETQIGGGPTEDLEILNNEILELQNTKIQSELDLDRMCEDFDRFKYNFNKLSKIVADIINFNNIKDKSIEINEINNLKIENEQIAKKYLDRMRNQFDDEKQLEINQINDNIKYEENEIKNIEDKIEQLTKNIESEEIERDNEINKEGPKNDILNLKHDCEQLRDDINMLESNIKNIEEEIKNLRDMKLKIPKGIATTVITNFNDIRVCLREIEKFIDIDNKPESDEFIDFYRKIHNNIIELNDDQSGGAQRRSITSNRYNNFKKQILDQNINNGAINYGYNIANFNILDLFQISNTENVNTLLGMHQMLKTYHINDIIPNSQANEIIVYWIWILLSELIYFDFTVGNNDFNYLNYDNENHKSIVELARKIYIQNDAGLNPNLNWLNKEFINEKEKLVYAISLYVNKLMPQKPLLSHVTDTIFIIRTINDPVDILLKLETLHLNIDNIPDYLLNPDEFVTDWIVRTPGIIYNSNDFSQINYVLPSRLKFFINYTNINDINDKVFIVSKFLESYVMGFDFLGCFPKINPNEEGNLLRIVNDPRSAIVNSGFPSDNASESLNYKYCDNHGIIKKEDLVNYLNDRINFYQSVIDDLNTDLMNPDVNNQQQISINNQIAEINIELAHIDPGAIGNATIAGLNNIRQDYMTLVVNNDFIILDNDISLSHYRLSNSRGLMNFIIEMKNNINNYFKKSLLAEDPYFSVYEEILKLRIDSDSFERIFSETYPILLTLDDLSDEYSNYKKQMILTSVITNNLETNIRENIDTIFRFNMFDLRTFDNYINNINSFYFMYYYFAYDSDVFRIPKFNYYKIPISKENKFKLYGNDDDLRKIDFGANDNGIANNQDDEVNYGIDYRNQDGGAESARGFIHQNDVTSFNRFIIGILNGSKYISPQIITDDMRLSKTTSLIPPSIEDNLYQFYKLTVLDLIIKHSQNIYMNIPQNIRPVLGKISKIYNVEQNQEDIVLLYHISKTIEDIVSRYFTELVRFNTNSIFRNFISGNNRFSDNEELKYINNESTQFDFNLTTLNDDIDKLSTVGDKFELADARARNIIKKRFVLDLYNMTEDYDENIDQCGRNTKNDFILYSNDYTSTNLTTDLVKVSIDSDILEKLLLSGAKLFIANKENKMPVFKILNHNNYYILKKLCGSGPLDFGINYNYLGSKNYDNPIQYMSDSLKNHANRLINSKNNLKDILKSFNFNCYQEVNMLINSDKKFGYNTLKNIQFSYDIVGYLINQYLSTYLYNIKDIRRRNNNSYYYFNNYPNVPRTNNDLAITELKNEISSYINKNAQKIRDLNLFQQNNDQKQDMANRLQAEINELTTLDNRLDFLSTGIDLSPIPRNRDYEIIENYESISNNNIENGPAIEAWKTLIRSSQNQELINIQDDNLILFRAVIYSSGNYDRRIFDECEKILGFTSELCEDYFTEHKYTDINPTLLFINKLLVMMTKNIICSGIEIFTRKLLLKYLLQKFPDQDFLFYYNKINSVFNDRTVRKTSLSKFLYGEVVERLVINTSNIFKNRDHEINHSLESVEDIFSEFIGLVETNGIINITEEDMIIKILKRDVLKYFSLITPTMIKNWQVTCENYMRFYINHFRILKCYNTLI